MSQHGVESSPFGKTSRRGFLKAAAAWGVAVPALAPTRLSRANPAPHSILAYVGTYSSPQGAEGAIGRGQGIYLFEMNSATGALVQRELFPNGDNPACLAFDPSRTHLYSANETRNYQGASAGSLSAYAIDRNNGHLTLLNIVSSEGAGPTHLHVHPSGKFVLVACYFEGSVAVFPIRANGELGPATDVIHDQGPVSKKHSTNAPPGSFAFSGHDKTHDHMILPDPAGRFVVAADIGLDRILVWKFDAENGKLVPQ